METIMTKQPPTLEQRINVVLQPDAAVTSANLAALLEETETYIAKADQGWTVDQTSSLDPGAARQAMTAVLVANGLRLLLPKLQARYKQVHEQEQAAAWWAKREAAWLTEYDALKRSRDALAEELREVYPNAVSKIANLFGRIAVNNEALSELHRSRPDAVEKYLRSAELHARGLESFTYNTPSLLNSVHLFDWDTGHQIWPPRRPSLASAFAAVEPPHDSHRFSADWAKDNERRAAAQKAEQQRIADFYARQTQQQEERENAEARERFAALQRKNRI
jgi:hypothetical protein